MTLIRESHRINIDEANRVYHIKIKEKKIFDQWIEQMGLHKAYRQKLFEESSLIKKNNTQNILDDKNLSNR